MAEVKQDTQHVSSDSLEVTIHRAATIQGKPTNNLEAVVDRHQREVIQLGSPETAIKKVGRIRFKTVSGTIFGFSIGTISTMEGIGRIMAQLTNLAENKGMDLPHFALGATELAVGLAVSTAATMTWYQRRVIINRIEDRLTNKIRESVFGPTTPQTSN